MKKTLALFLCITLLSGFSPNVFSAKDESPSMSDKTVYELYKERVSGENFCGKYKNSNSDGTEIIYKIDESNVYKEISLDEYPKVDYYAEAMALYRANMDGIYDCATGIVTKRALENIKDNLLSGEKLKARLKPKIEERIRKVEQQMTKCNISGEKKDTIIKKSVLKQTTYEYCRYTFYLEYLKEYSQYIVGLIPATGDTQSISIQEVLDAERERTAQIEKEYNDIDKAFEYAYRAYSEYENYIVVHILLDLLREDYLVLREMLHKTLNPINQVVYKIKNAMMP